MITEEARCARMASFLLPFNAGKLIEVKSMSARMSLLSYLSRGEQVTTKQARTMFKVSNVADLVYRLRNEGFSIYTNRVTTSRGEETFAYRLGTPSRAFLRNRASRHVARARQTLYAQALSA